MYAEDQRLIHIVIIATQDLNQRKKKMIQKIKAIKCKLVGHELKFAGHCPFTGSAYEYCERCEVMITLDEATE